MNDILDDERKEAFLQALEGLEAAKTQGHQHQHDDGSTQDDLQTAEPKPIEDHEQPPEHRRSNSERDYGVEEANPYRNPKDSERRPVSQANRKPSQQRNVKPTPSKASSKKAANNGVIHRSMAFVTAFQNLISNMAQSMSRNPLALLRFILFLLGLLVALSRRDVKDRIRRITTGVWDKMKRTVGMGVKVSYI